MTSLDPVVIAHIPLAAKLGFSAFMAVLVPVYLRNYGPTNFLYFCDAALLITLAGIWIESPLLLSIATCGILVPQLFWLVDYIANLCGLKITGMTDYMFDPKRSLLLRGLSLFHGWLPLMLIWLLYLTGYDARAFVIWTALATMLVLVCFFFMPGPTEQRTSIAPVNINYVFGFSDRKPQGWMPKPAWLMVALIGYPVVMYLPGHWLLEFMLPAANQTSLLSALR